MLTIFVVCAIYASASAQSMAIPSPTPMAQEGNTTAAPTASNAEGENAKPVRPCSGLWITGIHSRYFGSTNGAVFADEPVVQSEIDITCTKGRVSGTLILWGSKGFKSNWQSYSDEVDVIGTVTYSGKADFTVQFAHYQLVPQAGGNVQTAGIEVAKTFKLDKRNSIKTSAALDWYWSPKDGGPQSGKFVTLAASITRVLNEKVSFTNQIQYIRDIDGAFGFRPKTNVLRYDASVDIALGHNWTVTPKFTFGGAFGDPDRPGKPTFAVIFTKAFSF